MSNPSKSWLRSYGRTKGRKLKTGRAAALESGLEAYGLPEVLETTDAPASLFPVPVQSLALEVGFGSGEFLAAQAAAHPQTGFLGAEVFINGISYCCRLLQKNGSQNVRIYPYDARQLMEQLPDAALGIVYLLFPDPWPKTRHHKRRMVNAGFLAEVARLLKPGGQLVVATDNQAYTAWTLEHILKTRAFFWTAQSSADWRNQPAGWAATRYEHKNNNHRDQHPVYLVFEKRAAA